MACFPLFVELSGKEVLVAGGGKVAERKVGTLLEFGAGIRLVSPAVTGGLQSLADSGAVRLRKREYRKEDLEGAALAVAATGDREVNRRIHSDAAGRSIPVNVVDDPELCTFYFPAVVHRKDLVVGITTSGSYPAFTKYARQKVEELFPESCGEVVEVLKSYREKVRREVKDPAVRRQILEKLLEIAVKAAESTEAEDHAVCRICPRDRRTGRGLSLSHE